VRTCLSREFAILRREKLRFSAGVRAGASGAGGRDVHKDFALYERAVGYPRRRLIWIYVLRNSVTLAVTQIGLLFGALIAGAVVVEAIFDWPGIANYAVLAILTADYKVMLAVTLLIGVICCVLAIRLRLFEPVPPCRTGLHHNRTSIGKRFRSSNRLPALAGALLGRSRRLTALGSATPLRFDGQSGPGLPRQSSVEPGASGLFGALWVASTVFTTRQEAKRSCLAVRSGCSSISGHTSQGRPHQSPHARYPPGNLGRSGGTARVGRRKEFRCAKPGPTPTTNLRAPRINLAGGLDEPRRQTPCTAAPRQDQLDREYDGG
jgi:hypothetical protein